MPRSKQTAIKASTSTKHSTTSSNDTKKKQHVTKKDKTQKTVASGVNKKRITSRQMAFGFRKLSRAAGYFPYWSSLTNFQGASGLDTLQYMLSEHDMARLFHYTPQLSDCAFTPKETQAREKLLSERITPRAMELAQQQFDLLLRKVMNAVVMQCVMNQRLQIRASSVIQAIAPFYGTSMFTLADPPPGMITYGKEKGFLSPQAQTPKAFDEEKAMNAFKSDAQTAFKAAAKAKARSTTLQANVSSSK